MQSNQKKMRMTNDVRKKTLNGMLKTTN